MIFSYQCLYKIIWLFILLNACQRADPLPTANLEMIVIDDNALPAGNVGITLYRSKENWNTESEPVLTERLTDASGTAVFLGLQGGTYYVDAQKDSSNNWEKSVEIDLTAARFGFTNIAFTIIDFSISGIIADPAGKLWQIKTISINDQTVDMPCLRDDTHTFYKGGRYTLMTGQQACTTNEIQSQEGSWSLNNLKTALIITLPNRVDSWIITDFGQNKFVVKQNINDQIASVLYEVSDG